LKQEDLKFKARLGKDGETLSQKEKKKRGVLRMQLNWESTCLARLRSWVQSQYWKRETEEKVREGEGAGGEGREREGRERRALSNAQDIVGTK
jgi:hypothetical protein